VADLTQDKCEVCGANATGYHGMDVTPLCTNHLNQAYAREEATVKYMAEKRELRTDIPNEYNVKQVILVRRDLGMRRGKEIAQGAHASIAFLTNLMSNLRGDLEAFGHGKPEVVVPMAVDLGLDEEAWAWINDRFTKVVLQVFSEEELLDYHQKALDAGLRANLIQDSGQTEFGGELTYTTCAIGPNYAEAIDKVTGDLRLY